MLFPEQKPGQQAQDDARQDTGGDGEVEREVVTLDQDVAGELADRAEYTGEASGQDENGAHEEDRKSTRLNSSHLGISYAVFCLKKKKKKKLASLRIVHLNH